LPFRRIRQLRDHSGEKAEHAAVLHKIKTADRHDTDHGADNCRPDEISLAGCVHQKDNPKHRESRLRENA